MCNVDGSTVNLLATAKAIATATSQLITMRVLPFNFLFSLLALAHKMEERLFEEIQ
jgi:hypothetical protein